METKASWVHIVAGLVALAAAAMLVVALLVTDVGVVEDIRSPVDMAQGRR